MVGEKEMRMREKEKEKRLQDLGAARDKGESGMRRECRRRSALLFALASAEDERREERKESRGKEDKIVKRRA